MILRPILLIVLFSFSSAKSNQSDKKETFVFIHGANVGAWNFYKLKIILEQKGHTVITFDLPAMGVDKADPKQITLQDHVNKAVQVLDSLNDPAIVLGHSYGGVILSEVAEARPNKIKIAVYLSAFMLQNGEYALLAKRRNPEPLPTDVTSFSFDENGNPLTFNFNLKYFKDILCANCCEEDITLAKSLFVAQPASTFVGPIRIGANYNSVKKVYISALEDKSIQPGLQEEMYSKFPGTKVYKIKSSHMVFLEKPRKLANILLGLI